MDDHGGNIFEIADKLSLAPEDLSDFSANINPAGFPSWVREEISRKTSSIIHYPDRNRKDFLHAASEYHGISPDMIFAGNGAGELIDLLPRVLQPERTIIPVPSYSEYRRSGSRYGTTDLFKLPEESGFLLDPAKLRSTLLDRGRDTCRRQLVFIGQPNNPTAAATDPEVIRMLAEEAADTFFCIDESFIDFAPDYRFSLTNLPRNCIILRSMTKFYALPGLRIGYCIAHPEIIKKLKQYAVPWSVNSLALAVGTRAFSDTQYRKKTIQTVDTLRQDLIKNLKSFLWLQVFPSTVNFLLIKIKSGIAAAEELYTYMLNKRIIIRTCSNFEGLDTSFIRIAVRTEEENRKLLTALEEFERDKETGSRKFSPAVLPRKRRTPALMIQGTSSNAGKSILTAGLCRILSREGIHVAPFKAQNMSLNSAVTPDGHEIGRAQALQAAAAGIPPDVTMNPLLLKPAGDRGSDIILRGVHHGYLTAENWFKVKKEAQQVILESYDTLASQYDALLLEGAGSPAEINLKRGDIVNMAMAQYARAPVLIVGDIDRGGVYASFIGTMEVFEEWERKLVRGFIVNKFRGNRDLLNSAHEYVQYRTGLPVVGVVPFFRDISLPEEDSVSFKEAISPLAEERTSELSLGILDLPSISNFTDFDPLFAEKNITVSVIRKRKDMNEKFDALVIPGSKDVVHDLSYLQREGFAQAMAKTAAEGRTEIIGICGGFQMLGHAILDPQKVESGRTSVKGLGLLGINTRFRAEKKLKNTVTVHVPSNTMVTGYEIHHGISEVHNGKIILGDAGNVIGVSSPDGKIWGTYLHGIFDNVPFRRWFVNRLRISKGLDPLTETTGEYNLDKNLNALADILEKNLDISFIKKLLKPS